MYNLPMNFEDFLRKMYGGTINGHLWYLYMFIGYLISLPVLRKLVRSMDVKVIVYMFGVAIFFTGVLPTVEYLMFDRMYILNNNMRVSWIVPNMVLYPCMGYFVEHKLDQNSMKRILPWVWGANIVCVALSCYMTYKNILENPSANIQEWLNVFVAVNAICIYLTIKLIMEDRKLNRILTAIICSLGECTFGIYLFHIAVKDRPYMKEIFNKILAAEYNLMLSYVAFTLLVFLLTYILVFIMKKIPGMKKII